MGIEVVYLTRNNPSTIIVKEDGVVLDFSTVTRMTLSLVGSDEVIDTDADSSLIDYSQGGGVVEFNLNDLSVEACTYPATLVAYDPTHTDGQVLLHAAIHELEFRFIS